jgi:hypothetical protein
VLGGLVYLGFVALNVSLVIGFVGSDHLALAVLFGLSAAVCLAGAIRCFMEARREG